MNFTLVNLDVFLLAFIPALINLGIAAYLFFRMPHRPLINIFILLLLTSTSWQLSCAFMRISADWQTAMFCDNLFSQMGFFSGPLMLHFTLVYTDRIRKAFLRYGIYVLYFIIFIFTTLYPSVNSEGSYVYSDVWGWINNRTSGAYAISLGIFITLPILASVAMLVFEMIRAKRGTNKYKRLLLINTSVAIVILQSIVTDMLLPRLNIPPASLTPTIMVIFALATFIALTRYNLFQGEETISKAELLASVSDLVIVANKNLEISYINEAGLKLLSSTLDELEGTLLTDVFKVEGGLDSGLQQMFIQNAGTAGANIKATLLASNGTSTPVLAKASLLKPENNREEILLLARNIKDIEQAHAEISKSERRFRKILERSKDAVALVRADGIIMDPTPSIINVLGYTQDEFEGRNFAEFIHPDSMQTAIEAFYENTTTKNNRSVIVRALHKNGQYIWAECTGINYLDDPEINAIVTVFRDVTERIHTQQAQEKLLVLYTALIENMKHSVVVIDDEGQIFAVNRAYCHIMGFEKMPEELIGCNGSELLQQAKKQIKNPDLFVARIKELNAEKLIVLNERVDFANGEIYERDYIPIFTKDGEYKGRLYQYRNVTEKIEVQERLKEQNSFLELTQEIGQMGSWTANLKTGESWWSKESMAVHGIKAAEFDSRTDTFFSFVHPNDLELVNSAYQMAVSQGKPYYSAEFRLVLRNGNIKWVFNRTLVEYEDNIPVRLVGITQDITNRKNTETEIYKQNEKLKKINYELDKFVYSASHDIRSPLMSILGLVDIASSEVTDMGAQLYFRMIKDLVLKLDDFTLKIIHFSRNENTEPVFEKFSLVELVEEVVTSLKYQEMARDIEFRINIPQAEEIISDRARLQIVLSNLVSNAIKFQRDNNEHPLIAIEANRTANGLHLTVADNGEGIPSEKINQVFAMFTRFSMQSKGSGLGLYIVKGIVEKLNGNIEVKSRLGEGSAFTIQLPHIE